MQYSFYDLGLLWAANTGASEVPSTDDVRNHIQSTVNLSPKRVSDADVADFIQGVTEALATVEAVAEDIVEDIIEEMPLGDDIEEEEDYEEDEDEEE